MVLQVQRKQASGVLAFLQAASCVCSSYECMFLRSSWFFEQKTVRPSTWLINLNSKVVHFGIRFKSQITLAVNQTLVSENREKFLYSLYKYTKMCVKFENFCRCGTVIIDGHMKSRCAIDCRSGHYPVNKSQTINYLHNRWQFSKFKDIKSFKDDL